MTSATAVNETLVRLPEKPVACQNFVGGQWVQPSGPAHPVVSPYSGAAIGTVWESTPEDVNTAVKAAARVARDWAAVPLRERCALMLRLRQGLLSQLETLSHTISAESGKTLAEARAGLLKGIEVIEFAASLQNLDSGGKMAVSQGVTCEFRREPLGVVAGITPFNFPAMVPLWMIPLALTVGNCFVWKPSDKTPLTSLLLTRLLGEAGLPEGVFTVVQGGVRTVESLLDHPDVAAIGFVGSTPVARQVYARGCAAGKRVLALGGAKNHIFLLPDADPEKAARSICDSFTGCAGQRCMAASVLLAIGKDVEPILEELTKVSAQLQLGPQMGALISRHSRDRLVAAIATAEKNGARIRLDGRTVPPPAAFPHGHWLGPTLLDGVPPQSEAATEELFGPVLSIVRCQNLSEALAVQQRSPYGNAASVFTASGSIAERIASEARAGMIGINVGVPVPREPFSFGGINQSKFGHGEITGARALDFWSDLKKVTTKWEWHADLNWMSR